MTDKKSTPPKDRSPEDRSPEDRSPEDRTKVRSDIGKVEFPIEKLMRFRDASASCVHVEAAMEADRGLADAGKKSPK